MKEGLLRRISPVVLRIMPSHPVLTNLAEYAYHVSCNQKRLRTLLPCPLDVLFALRYLGGGHHVHVLVVLLCSALLVHVPGGSRMEAISLLAG